MQKKNIYRRSDGRWEARVTVGKKENGKPKTKSFYGNTKAEAEKKREEFIKNSKTNLKQNSTFQEVCQAWMAEKKNTLKQSSRITYENRLSKYIFPYFGNMTFAEADSLEQGFIHHLAENKSISDTSRKEAIILYRSIIYWYKDEHNASNKREKTEIVFFTDREWDIITNMIGRETMELAISVYTGMTISELSALKWSDCDLVKRVITVSKSLQRVTDSTPGETTKTRLIETEIPTREIPIATKLLKIMESIPKSRRKGYVLGGGSPTESRTIQNHITRFLAGIGLEGSPSKFRDTFAVKAIRNGINPLFIAKVMGVTPEGVMKRYKPFFEETVSDEKLVAVVEAI